MKKRTKEEVLSKIKEIDGDVFDFSEATYTNTHGKLVTTCKKCGHKWTPIVQSLLNGCGCPKCSAKERGKKSREQFSKQDFITKVKSKLRIKQNYNFSLLPDIIYEYNTNIPVEVMCNKHGKFSITTKQLLDGTGCPECYKEFARSHKVMPEEEFRKKLLALNPNLTYNPEEYKNTVSDINFTCNVCGNSFIRKVNSILYQTAKCPHCNKLTISQERTKTTEQYIEDVHKVWGNKYGTEHIIYKGSDKPVTPTCPEHGDFSIEANSFLQGHGCPYHFTIFSKQEKEILSFIREELGYKEASSSRKILGERNEIDIYVPSKNIGFEYDGLYWHNELNKDKNFHLNKTNKCKEKGVTLYHIFEDEWLYKSGIVKSMIENILQKTPNKIGARKCEVREIDSKSCSEFLLNNHIQGNCLGKIRIGLFYKDELVSVMLMGHSRHFAGSGKEEWELLRMCSKLHYTIMGGASKMFNYFIKKYKPKSIITFADKRWSIGNVYNKLGFSLYNESRPNYYYVIGDKRYYRYNFRKSVLIKKYGCPAEMTEKDFCFKQKWYRIYDCGCLCYKWLSQN